MEPSIIKRSQISRVSPTISVVPLFVKFIFFTNYDHRFSVSVSKKYSTPFSFIVVLAWSSYKVYRALQEITLKTLLI